MHAQPNTRVITAAAVILILAATPSEGADSGPLALEELDGRPAELSLGPGEAALVVHFWATWCASCVEELGVLDSAARACGGGIRVVAVNVAEEVEKIRGFLAVHDLGLRQLRDANGDVWRGVSSRGLPVNLIWTAAGRRVESGPRDAKAWRKILDELGCP